MIITLKNPALRRQENTEKAISSAKVDARTFTTSPSQATQTGANDPITGEWYAFSTYPATYPIKYRTGG
jgi:hypothetical protein